MIEIKIAQEQDIATIENIAQRSWRHGYNGVISQDQIAFMLERIYSPNALLRAMEEGQTFYLLSRDNQHIGFVALGRVLKDVLRIEKLYLVPEAQGEGMGKRLIDYAAERGKQHGAKELELNVNRKNKAYNFYLKQGFLVVCEVDIPYHGYVLDDYVMRKPIV